MYKNKRKNIFKSHSVNNKENNNILNKIKHDIALIKFENEMNKIYNNQSHHNHLFLKGETLNNNKIYNSN